MSDLYAQAGVNIQAGDDFSEIAGRLCQSTYENCKFVTVHNFSKGNFRGPRPFKVEEGRGFYFDAGPDGVGTKVGLYDALIHHPKAARDLVAMTAGDITRYGGLPAVFWNILSVRSLDDPGTSRFQLFTRTLEELIAAGNEIDMVIHKGETAEKGDFVGTDSKHPYAPFDWEAVAFGICHPDKLIYGDRVRVGDVVIALREDGFRSNGISLVRKAFLRQHGLDYQASKRAHRDLLLAAEPSVLYDKMLTTAHGWYNTDLEPLFDLRLIAHITGGGMGKFAELLRPTGLSAVLYDLYEPPEIMQKCARWMDVPDDQFYRTWNGGQGMLVVIPADQVDAFLRHSGSFGIAAQVCGDITSSTTTSVVVASQLHVGEKAIFD